MLVKDPQRFSFVSRSLLLVIEDHLNIMGGAEDTSAMFTNWFGLPHLALFWDGERDSWKEKLNRLIRGSQLREPVFS